MTSTIALNFSAEMLLGAGLFVLGTIFGSFLNVVSFRYPSTPLRTGPKESFLGGRSRCLFCGKNLKWYELIPILSFLIQLGRCRGCGKRLSFQYPLVEILTGTAFLLPIHFYKYYGFPPHSYRGGLLAIWLLIALAMILLSLIDWKKMIIPDELSILLAAAGVILAFLGSESFLKNYTDWLFPQLNGGLLRHVVGGMSGLALLGLIFFISRGRAMGMGDVKLAGAIGLILGWPDIILSLALGFLMGGFFGLGLLIRGQRMRTLVPFGPFLVIGFWLHIFFGYQLVAWYFSLV